MSEYVEPAKAGMPPAGAYVVKVLSHSVSGDGGELAAVWDISEGCYQGHYSNAFGWRNPWVHSFDVPLDEGSSRWKHFVGSLEKSNPGFSRHSWKPGDATSLSGLELGILLGRKLYTNANGEDKETRYVVGFCSADDARSGKKTAPEDIDERVRPSIDYADGFVEVNAVRCPWCGERFGFDGAERVREAVAALEADDGAFWECPDCGRESRVSASVLIDVAGTAVRARTPYGEDVVAVFETKRP